MAVLLLMKIANLCTHLMKSQQDDLAKLFEKFETLFDGTLHKYTNEKIHLDINSTVTPHHSHTYTVPHTQQDVFKRELEHLVEIGVLKKCGRAD